MPEVANLHESEEIALISFDDTNGIVPRKFVPYDYPINGQWRRMKCAMCDDSEDIAR